MWEIYPRIREVILVRDFRDMVASMFAYNAKRGREGFRRDSVASDAEYVGRQVKGSVSALAAAASTRGATAPTWSATRTWWAIPRPRSPRCCATSGSTSSPIAEMAEALRARGAETEWHRTTADPAASIGRWRHDLAPEARRACEEALAPELRAFGYATEEAIGLMVIGRDFAWAHLPKTGGDATLAMFRLFPDLIEFADPDDTNDKHAQFHARAQQIRGKLLVMNFRRLPSWVLSRAQHVARRGLYPDYQPQPMGTADELAESSFPDSRIVLYTGEGRFHPDRWLRMETLAEDFLDFISDFRALSDDERERVRAIGAVNQAEYDHRGGELVLARSGDAHVSQQPVVGDARTGALRGPVRNRRGGPGSGARLMSVWEVLESGRAAGVRGAPALLVHGDPAHRPPTATCTRWTSRAG